MHCSPGALPGRRSCAGGRATLRLRGRRPATCAGPHHWAPPPAAACPRVPPAVAPVGVRSASTPLPRAQAADNYRDLARAPAAPPPPPGCVVRRILVAERDAVMARALRAAAGQAAAGAGSPVAEDSARPGPGAGGHRACVVGVIGATHLPGVEAEWAGARAARPQRDAGERTAAAAASRGGQATGLGGGAGKDVSGGAPSRAATGAAVGGGCGCDPPGEAGTSGTSRPSPELPQSPRSTLDGASEPDQAPHAAAAAGQLAGGAARGQAACVESPIDDLGDAAAGVRRALLERLVDLLALPEVGDDLRASLPCLAAGAAAGAYEDASELYGHPRMLMACLDRMELAQVRPLSV
jgi:hypothetical protein